MSIKYLKTPIFTLIIFFFSTSFLHFNSHPFLQNNFYQAKLWATKIHKYAPGSFYCQCKIIWKEKKGIPDFNTCGYKIRKNKQRAMRIEWEHIVPAWQFGHQKLCWKQGGRKNCKIDIEYKKIESDLHNIQPAIGEINGDRANFMYSQWNQKENKYGTCDIKIDFKNKKIEPSNLIKGTIARTYFYIKNRYHLKISKKQMKMFKIWDKKYPVKYWECKRDMLIFNIQGNHNNYVLQSCKKNNTNSN